MICALQPQEPRKFPVIAIKINILLYTKKLMRDRKLLSGLSHYERYKKVISEIIKEHEYNLNYFGKVENLGSHSVKNEMETFV